MSYFEFPHTRDYDGDLGYIIKKLEELTAKYDNFFEYNFISFNDPLNWTINKAYDAWKIVYDPISKYIFISKKPVPVGIDIFNEDYWYKIAPFGVDTSLNTSSYNPIANRPVAVKFNSLEALINELNERLAAEAQTRATADNTLNAAISSNTTAINTEIVNRSTADSLLSARIDEIISGGSVDPDAELVDIRVAANGKTYAAAGDAVRYMDGYIENSTFPMFGLNWIENCYLKSDGTIRTDAPGRLISDFIPCAENATVAYRCESNHNTIMGICFYDINKNFISGYQENAPDDTDATVTSPAGTAFARISTKTAYLETSYIYAPNGTLATILSDINAVVTKTKTAYIAPDGNDTTGDGSSLYPYATVNKALKEGSTNILLKGGKYFQAIDLSNAVDNKISISCAEIDKKAIFYYPQALCTTSASAVEGYDRVFSFPYTASIYRGIRLYQEGVPDSTTLISDAERNPYQRGQEYRCEDTKIVPCDSATLADALNEIENGTTYKYFYDTNNNIIYFSAPSLVSATYPIMRSGHPATLFTNTNRAFELDITGIEVKYTRFNVTNMKATLTDCKSSNCFGAGGFIYDSSIVKFIRCEANAVYYVDGAGDGFNAHSSTNNDAFAKQTTALLIDCWSHDCQDDGYSDHERAETEIHGGLFEYNGKAGITPSYGSHCSCYNVISRKNYSGFLYLGEATAAEGGKYGQLLCIDCIAINNNTNPDSGYGFGVSGEGNKIELINCRSIGNLFGYYASADTLINLNDCGSLDNNVEFYNNPTAIVNIKNTTIVN